MDLKIWTSRQGHNDLVCYWVLILIWLFRVINIILFHSYRFNQFHCTVQLYKCIYEYIRNYFWQQLQLNCIFQLQMTPIKFSDIHIWFILPPKKPQTQTARFFKFVYSFPNGSSLPVEAFYVKHDVTLTFDLFQIKRNMMQWIGMRNEHYIIFSMPLFDGH